MDRSRFVARMVDVAEAASSTIRPPRRPWKACRSWSRCLGKRVSPAATISRSTSRTTFARPSNACARRAARKSPSYSWPTRLCAGGPSSPSIVSWAVRRRLCEAARGGREKLLAAGSFWLTTAELRWQLPDIHQRIDVLLEQIVDRGGADGHDACMIDEFHRAKRGKKDGGTRFTRPTLQVCQLSATETRGHPPRCANGKWGRLSTCPTRLEILVLPPTPPVSAAKRSPITPPRRQSVARTSRARVPAPRRSQLPGDRRRWRDKSR